METIIMVGRKSGHSFPPTLVLVVVSTAVLTAVLTLFASDSTTRIFMYVWPMVILIGGLVWEFIGKNRR